MYPDEKRKPYPTRLLKNKWDEPLQKPAKKGAEPEEKDIENIELDANCLLKTLLEYLQTNFNNLGHHIQKNGVNGNWWHQTRFGTSYQPIVQMCYILKGQELRYDVREHHSHPNISRFAREIHNIDYDRETKFRSYRNIDVCWGKDAKSYLKQNLILALEFEDSGSFDDIFEELYTKLLTINSKYILLGGRLNSELGLEHISERVENKLNKDNIERPLIFIFIYPDSISEPTKIYFAQYIYFGSKLKRVDDKKYYINVFVEKTSGQVKIKK